VNPLIIIQARLGSTRLPGKVLMPIKGKPMLGYLFERLAGRPVCIATMDEKIGELGIAFGADCVLFEGDENDVASRFEAALANRGHPAFNRLCGDSPLMDPALIDAAIALYEPPYLEIRSPVGSVEVCDTAEFLAGLPMMTAHEREHVTLRLRPAGKTISVGNGQRLVVDTAEDFQRVVAVIEKMTRPHTDYSWREICALRS
jgi:spore coat polysaccharide biosynthesis protein SpsF (cytidylyltransferase family)